MSYKQLIAASAVSLSLLYGAPSMADGPGSCGWGTVIEVREGGFDQDHLYVRLKLIGAADANVENTLWRTLWVRYKSETISAERLNAIRSLAYLAFASGKTTYAYSHTAEGCSNATEMSLFDLNEIPDPRANGTDNSDPTDT